jgi:hypothetical protein
MARAVPIPPEVSARVAETLAARPKAPALLALVVMGKVSPTMIGRISPELSDELDEFYDEAEAKALAERADVRSLMRNDLAMHIVRTS